MVICDVVRNLYFNLKLFNKFLGLIKNLIDLVELMWGILILYLGLGKFRLGDGYGLGYFLNRIKFFFIL